jgi:uncharacterized integral membrane protein
MSVNQEGKRVRGLFNEYKKLLCYFVIVLVLVFSILSAAVAGFAYTMWARYEYFVGVVYIVTAVLLILIISVASANAFCNHYNYDYRRFLDDRKLFDKYINTYENLLESDNVIPIVSNPLLQKMFSTYPIVYYVLTQDVVSANVNTDTKELRIFVKSADGEQSWNISTKCGIPLGVSMKSCSITIYHDEINMDVPVAMITPRVQLNGSAIY